MIISRNDPSGILLEQVKEQEASGSDGPSENE